MSNTINPLKICTMAFLAGMLFVFLGCGDKTEPPKPEVFTQKINLDKNTPQAQKVPQTQAGPVKAALAPPEIKANEMKPADGTGEKPPATPPASSETTLASEDGYTYSPKGKIDPFMPWVEGEAVATQKQKVRKRLPRSPLEKVDLSQLKLAGIILSASGNKALVEDATGKGYVIAKGTYIGLDQGRVAEIRRDRVIVEESIQYGLRETTIRKKELKLQKPPGDM